MISSVQQSNPSISYIPIVTEIKGLTQVVAGVAEILYSDCVRGSPHEIERNQRAIVHFHNGRVNVKRGCPLCFPGFVLTVGAVGCYYLVSCQWSVLSL